MKIDSLAVQNFLGISATTIVPTEPLVIVAGHNAAGKTSLYQALRLALLGDVPRIDLMRDSKSLVKAGAERGAVQVVASDHGGRLGFGMSLPDRKRSGPDPFSGAMRFALEPHAFAALDPQERMRTILTLSKAGMDREVIKERLLVHGVRADVIAELAPQLLLPFESCADIAKNKASEWRGVWKGVTGETYGSKKAAGWKAQPGGPIGEAPASMETAMADAEQTALVYGDLLIAKNSAQKAAEARARDSVTAMRVQPLRGQIAALRVAADAEEDVPRHEIRCPHCRLVFWMADDFTKVFPDERPLTVQGTTVVEERAKVKPAQKRKAQIELAAALKDLAIAEAAAARIADPTPIAPGPTDAELEAAHEKRDQAADVLRSLRTQWEHYKELVAVDKQLRVREATAAEAHAAVEAWERAEEALSPGGIPSELMAAALAPLRAALRRVCASEAVSSWPLPELDDAGNITARGRPYPLLSRSEQYRVDLVLAAALSVTSGTRLLMADEADILEPHSREELVDWLLDMTEEPNSALDAAWIFMTLRAPPSGVLDGAFTYWIEDGSNRA